MGPNGSTWHLTVRQLYGEAPLHFGAGRYPEPTLLLAFSFLASIEQASLSNLTSSSIGPLETGQVFTVEFSTYFLVAAGLTYNVIMYLTRSDGGPRSGSEKCSH